MTDIPIIFSAPMVRALLAGRKTMTRRLAWREGRLSTISEGMDIPSPWQKVRPGDRLWVRENMKWSEFKDCWLYSADEAEVSLDADDPRIAKMIGWAHHREQDYCPSIHMPRWASRLTLIVTAAKIGHLHGKGAWESNPELVALTFTVHASNIDALKAAA